LPQNPFELLELFRNTFMIVNLKFAQLHLPFVLPALLLLHDPAQGQTPPDDTAGIVDIGAAGTGPIFLWLSIWTDCTCTIGRNVTLLTPAIMI